MIQFSLINIIGSCLNLFKLNFEKMSLKNVVLVGFMGSGKTLISHLLENQMQRPVISTDSEIELLEGISIEEIFAQKGEEYFRSKERDVVQLISDKIGVIIDCGGGIVLNDQNMVNLKKNGFLIFLKASPKKILSNIQLQEHKRPLLNVADPLSAIKELLDKRIKMYECADFTIEMGEKSLEAVADEIQEIMKNDRN